MEFSPSEEQRMVAETAREFAERELLPKAAARDREGTFPVEELRAMAKLGLLGVNVSEPLGGAQAGAVAYALAMMEIARADASVAVAMAVTNMVAELIERFGTDEQKRAHVPFLVGGDGLCGAFALSEPQSGTDASALATTATRTARGFVLDGAKQWITSGDRAGVIVAWAKSDAKAGAKGISCFIVRGGTPGLSAGKHEDKMGLRGSSTVPLRFDHCAIGEDALLGRENEGYRLALDALDGGRIGIASQACGVAQAALDAARAHTLQRHQFGRALAENQAIRFRLADVATELQAAKLLVLRAAWLKEKGRPFSREASIAKLYATEMAGRACDAAVQLHGGYGYTREYPVERYMRDARVQRIYEGTSEAQRMVIARHIVGEVK